VLDAVVAADPVEQDGGRAPAEPAGKHLPLSVRVCSGIPCRRSASVSAWQTGRAVARITAFADTTNREWSSIPVTILTSAPPYRQATSVTETPSLEYFLHCPVPLLHRTQLRQHARLPPPRPLMDRSEATGTPESP
jgi:hypothetical protein